MSHSEKSINHLLDQVSFLREQIKSKDQQINALLEHTSTCDEMYISKAVPLLPSNVIRQGTNSIYNACFFSHFTGVGFFIRSLPYGS